MASGYGHWLQRRAAFGFDRVQHSLPSGMKLSGYSLSAVVLSALLVLLTMLQYTGETFFKGTHLQLAPEGLVASGSAWYSPRVDRRMQEVPALPHPASEEWPNTVAVCVMTDNAHVDDVLEWVQYHKWLGVDKIFLRERTSDVFSKHADAFKDMVEDGILDIGKWHVGEQLQSKMLWLSRCSESDMGGAYSWILYPGSIDEYMVHMLGGGAHSKPDLKGYLSTRKDFTGLALHRVLFGSGGHVQRPGPGGPLRHYTQCKDLYSFPTRPLASTYHLCSTPFTDPKELDTCAYKTFEKKVGYRLNVAYGDGKNPWDMKFHKIALAEIQKAEADVAQAKIDQKHAERRTMNGQSLGSFIEKIRGPKDDVSVSNSVTSAGSEITVESTSKQRGTLSIPSDGDGGQECVTYQRGVHDPGYAQSPRTLGVTEALVLFHYVTRSYEEFVTTREPTLPGVYSDAFRDVWEQARAALNATTDADSSGVTEAQKDAKQAFDEFESRHRFNLEGVEHAACQSIVEANYVSNCCDAGSDV